MIKEKLKSFSNLFEAFLNKALYTENGEYTAHYDAMKYSLLMGGKRLRPFILKSFYCASGGKDESKSNSFGGTRLLFRNNWVLLLTAHIKNRPDTDTVLINIYK